MWECIECGAEFEVPSKDEWGEEVCPVCDSPFIEVI